MTKYYEEYPPLKLGDKIISPAGSDYVDNVGCEYYFGIMQMWDRMSNQADMYSLVTDITGKLWTCHSNTSFMDGVKVKATPDVQDAFQIYVMDKLILNSKDTHNRSDCITEEIVV